MIDTKAGKSATQLRATGTRWAFAAVACFASALALCVASLAIRSAQWPLVISGWACFAPAGLALILEIRAFRAAKRVDRTPPSRAIW